MVIHYTCVMVCFSMGCHPQCHFPHCPMWPCGVVSGTIKQCVSRFLKLTCGKAVSRSMGSIFSQLVIGIARLPDGF